MKNALIYYKAADVIATQSADFAHYSTLFHLLKAIPLVDRTGILTPPFALHALHPMPQFKPQSESFEEICNTRAAEVLARAEALDCGIALMWSGGIDSTLVLVSLLKMAKPAQVERITVLLSEESIAEAPEFYAKHICGKVKMASAQLFPHYLGGKDLFVTGEHSDQLFGSDMVGKLIIAEGAEVIHKPYDRAMMLRFFANEAVRKDVLHYGVDVFEYLASKAPIPITTNFEFLWWINFNLKWQSVYLRTLSFVADRNVGNLTPDYVSTRYLPFFTTEAFQLWSMNNPDKRIKADWASYKWVCKDIIFDYAKDESYKRNKVKRGSLFFIILRKTAWNYMDSSFALHRNVNLMDFHTPKNDYLTMLPAWRKTVG